MAHEPDETPLPEDFARDATRSAQAGPDAASRARIAAAVRARTSGGGPGGGAAGGGAGGRGGVWLAVAALVALLAYVAWPRESVAPSSSVDASPALDPILEAPRVAVVEVAEAPSVEAPSLAEVSAEGPTPIDAPETAVAPVVRAPAIPTEIELLDAAHGALARSPARALGYLERHASLYPDGLFEEEREALAIEALVRLDRRGRAEARADHFFAAHPSTAHRAHLLELLRSTESSEAP